MRTTKKERAEAIKWLRELFPPGSVAHTVLRNVSRSGMTRRIDVYAISDNQTQWVSRAVARVVGFTFNERHECLSVGGCGMDMGFHVVSTLSRVLYPDGFGCTGEGCRSNDHSNGDRDYTPHVLTDEDGEPENRAPGPGELRDGCICHWHRAGDYAVSHRWI